MRDWRFVVHLGSCCASHGAALGENWHTATEWDSNGREAQNPALGPIMFVLSFAFGCFLT